MYYCTGCDREKIKSCLRYKQFQEDLPIIAINLGNVLDPRCCIEDNYKYYEPISGRQTGLCFK